MTATVPTTTVPTAVRGGGALAGGALAGGALAGGALAGGVLAGTVLAGTVLAAALTVHTVLNLRVLRRPPAVGDCPASQPVLAVLLPLRDEATRVEPCLTALLTAMDRYEEHGSTATATAAAVPVAVAVADDTAGPVRSPAAPGWRPVELVVCDDGSTDDTAGVVRRVVGGDPRVRILTGDPLPAGWLGKPHACAQLVRAADPRAEVLVFLDADVVLAPDALVRSVALLATTGLDLVCPYPRQVVVGVVQRLVQPLLQWSWATTLPLRLAERSPRPSLGAANGQLLVVDRGVYDRAGGHDAVRGAVLEDLALLRAVKAIGGYGGVVDGTEVATCAMYDDTAGLVAGYTKSLWAAFGPPPAAGALATVLLVAYVLPAAAMLAGSPVGALGYAAGVAGRLAVARRTGGRLADCLAHPLSVLALTALLGRSWQARRAGTLSWRGRPVVPAVAEGPGSDGLGPDGTGPAGSAASRPGPADTAPADTEQVGRVRP